VSTQHRAHDAGISDVLLSRVGTHLEARLAPNTDLGVIAGEMAIAAAAAHDNNA
jgi:hypothetical protein